MTGELDRQQEIELFKFLADITSINDLGELLSYVVQKSPNLLRVRRCSIYLVPKFVPQFTGELIDDPNIIPINANSLRDDFIVLAQTNFEGKQEFIGKIFYTSGSDLTGWVFKSGKSLRLKNARDRNELAAIDPALKASVRYVSVEPETDFRDIFPILYLPLQIDQETIGVFKLHQPLDLSGFEEIDEQVAKITSQIISGLIKRIKIADQQNKKLQLYSILGTETNPDNVLENITKSIPEMLDCPKSQIYLRNETEDSLYLAYENGQIYKGYNIPSYKSGEGTIGWIFQTGFSLRINDLSRFLNKTYLTDELLLEISEEGIEIDNEYRFLELKENNKSYISSLNRKIPFLGVPIINTDGSVEGVLCAHSLTRSRHRQLRTSPFTESDLQRLKTYSTTIGLSVLAERTKSKGEILLKLSQSNNPEELFNIIIQNLPKLIHDTDCFYYKLIKNEEPYLELQTTNKDKQVLSEPTKYKIGEGKTGFCALAQNTLIFDHFGGGVSNTTKTQNQVSKLRETYPEDLLTDLKDETGNSVGIIRLQNGKSLDEEIQSLFFKLQETQIISKDIGLPSNRLSAYLHMNSKPSHSFIGVPIILEKNKLEGVITITRPIRNTPFSPDDIEYVQAIGKTISQVISILELQEQRKKLYITLAHEITTYITPIQADAENLQNEATSIPELGKMASHMFGQIQRLQLMSENILGVLSGKKTGEKFTTHSIYRPVIDAVKMYKDEAQELGYEILGPRAIGKKRFPEIEMRLFELTLAFKNIIHNAIKYSYKPSNKRYLGRYIKIIGKWNDKEEKEYCISIENYGVGITEEEIKKRLIFNDFYRGLLSSDRQRPGSGIGLAYVSQIIEGMHKGKIIVTSKPMEGTAYLTTFNIILPLQQKS